MKTLPHYITSFLNAHRYISALLFFLVLFTLTFAAFAQVEKTTIYFYSSETSINNFKSLKMEFDRYLSKLGPYEFQPFSEREAFEQYVKDKKQCILLLSSWHYSKINKAYALTATLAGTRNGQKYQKRVLVTKDESVKTGRVASASSIEHTSSYLRAMLKGKEIIDKIQVLTVPKDIDALMSVGFGMSKMALTSGSALDELKKVNPTLHQKMKILAEGEESLSLIVAVPKGFRKEAAKIVAIFQNMATDPDGKEKLMMLGLDGWQPLNPSEKLKLEAQ
jgi:hypothetical protein